MGFDIDFRLLGRPADVGGAFQAGLQTGQAARREREQQNALAAYAQNPNDPSSLNALSAVNPQLGIQLQNQIHQRRQQDLQYQRQNQADARDQEKVMQGHILNGAKIIREINPQDEAGWQQVLAISARAGIPLDGVPQTFDPTYVQGVVKYADALDPEKEVADTSMQRNYEFLSGRDLKLADEYLRSQANPFRFVPDGQGGVTVVNPAGFGGTAPASRPTASSGGSGGSFQQSGAVNLTQAANFGSRFGTVTNTKREPGDYERLQSSGYKPARNSYHNVGRAIDIDRKPGVTHDQIVEEYRRAGFSINADTRDEGDHSHIVFDAGPSGRTAGNGSPRRVNSEQEFASLPSGTQFVAPDGSVREKP